MDSTHRITAVFAAAGLRPFAEIAFVTSAAGRPPRQPGLAARTATSRTRPMLCAIDRRTNMNRIILMTVLCVAFFCACSDDSDRQLDICNPRHIEALLFMQNDPRCFDIHADIQFTVSDGNTEYVLLELLFDRGPPYNIPFSEIMTFACVESLQVDFMCYSDESWRRSEGTIKIPVPCYEFVYISVYADTIHPLSIIKNYDGYIAFELGDNFKCTEVESLYFAWGSVSD